MKKTFLMLMASAFMRTISILFFLVVFSISSFCQKPKLTKEEYFQKSKDNRQGAWIMLGLGTTCLAIASKGNISFSTLPILVFGGAGLVIGSIPCFLAAGKNKRKAMSVAFNNEMVPMLQNGSFCKSFCPSLGIKIGL